MKIFILNIIFFVSCSHLLFGQVVKGKISSEDSANLSGAIVHVLNTNYSCVSDSSGNYFLSIKSGKYTFNIQAIGYSNYLKTVDVVDSVLALDFVLTPISHSLSEVIVTANKREEDLINVPISITSLSSDKISQSNTTDLSQLSAIVPNYQYGNLGVGYQQQIALRGISVFSETPAVATYVDGVCAMDIAANGLQMFDIDRIEILRGPQGTLYGRNAMGGVINIITKTPNNQFSSQMQSSIGNQGLQKYGIVVRTPVVRNKLFFGISAQYQKQNGFYINDLSDKTTFLHEPLKGSPTDGLRMGDEESIYGTLYLKWIINSKWVLSINSKAQIDQSVGASAYYQAVENDSIAKIDPYKFAVNDVGTNSRKISNTSISVTSFQDKFTVHSISSFQYILQAYDHIDQDLLPYDYAYGSSYKDNLGEAYPQSVCSEELRFSSPNNSSKFKWTAGAYFFRQESNKKYATVYKDLAYFFGSTPGIEVNQANTLNSGAAIFAQVDYSILPSLIFTTGCRFDLETRKAEVSRYRVDEQNNVLSYSYPVTNKQKQYTALSPKLILKFNFTSSHSIYVSYTRGFRAGGINLFSKKVEYNYFDPEYSDNYEFGHKIQSRNKKVLITSSLFAYYWQQLQLDLQPEPGIWITSNIGNVKSVGAEIECSFSPFMGFLVDAALGVNDAKYMGFDYLGTNIKGNQTIFAPKSTFFIAAQQLFPIGKKTLFSLRGEWRRVGLHYFDLVNEIEQKPYNLFNAKIGAEVKNVVVSFWCYNLLDTQYLTYAMPGYFKYSLLNRPRTYGITLSMKFNK